MTSALPPLIDLAHLHALRTQAAEGQLALHLLDVRWALDGSKGRDTYRAGHLPGAVYIDLDTELPRPRRRRAPPPALRGGLRGLAAPRRRGSGLDGDRL